MPEATLSDVIAAAVVTSVPATIAATFAAWQSRRSKQEAQAVNRAVNNRPPGEPSLYELAARALATAESVDAKVDRVDRKLEHHLGWHQVEGERRDRLRRWWQR